MPGNGSEHTILQRIHVQSDPVHIQAQSDTVQITLSTVINVTTKQNADVISTDIKGKFITMERCSSVRIASMKQAVKSHLKLTCGGFIRRGIYLSASTVILQAPTHRNALFEYLADERADERADIHVNTERVRDRFLGDVQADLIAIELFPNER